MDALRAVDSAGPEPSNCTAPAFDAAQLKAERAQLSCLAPSFYGR